MFVCLFINLVHVRLFWELQGKGIGKKNYRIPYFQFILKFSKRGCGVSAHLTLCNKALFFLAKKMNKLLNIVVMAGMVGLARAACDVEAINPVSAREATNYRYSLI